MKTLLFAAKYFYFYFFGFIGFNEKVFFAVENSVSV